MIIVLNRLKNILLSPLFIGIIFFLLLQFQFFNLDIGYRDEGFLFNNAQSINEGKMPYSDFFLAITPGTYYIQAMVMRVFGNYLITGRILYIVFTVLILVLVNSLSKLTKYLNYVVLIILGVLYAGDISFASYNIEALVFILISFLFFKRLISSNYKNNYLYFLLIGISNSVAFLIKQTYGGVFFFVFIILIMVFTQRKYLLKNISIYLIGNLILPSILLLTFYVNGRLSELIYGLINYSLLVKNDRIPYILTSLLFIPFCFVAVNILKIFSLKRLMSVIFSALLFLIIYIVISPGRINYIKFFYKDVSIYYFIFLFIFPIFLINKFIKSKNKDNQNLTIMSLVALGLFLASSFSGRDYATVVVTSPIYIPLISSAWLMISKRIKLFWKNFFITGLLILFILHSILYLGGIIGRLYGIGYQKTIYANLDVKEAKYIKIPVSQKKDLESVIKYVKTTSSGNSKLLCFPYCPLLNFLTERSNASFFYFFYKFNSRDQAAVIRDIKNKKDLTIIVQRPADIEKEANFEDKRLSVLKEYILSNYKLKKVFKNFYVYRGNI